MNNLDKLKTRISRLPAWLFTVVTVMLILWLTLAPDPLGDDAPELFPGADKLVHGIMFGFLTLMILLDRQRRLHWNPLPFIFVWLAAAASAIFGIIIEITQLKMDMGRGFEIADMIADTAGAALAATLWLIWQSKWSSTQP